jgi:hypothetical protein
MRLRRTFLTTGVVAAALAVALGTAPADAASKPDSNAPQGSSKSIPADQAAGSTVQAVPQAVSLASATIQSRILNFVQANGTKSTFGAYIDRGIGKVVIQTDAPAEVVSSLVGTYRDQVEVRKQAISDDFSRKSDTPAFYGGAGVSTSRFTPWCSSGYVVQNSAGTRFMVDAGHCFSNGQTAVTENGGLTVGSAFGNGLAFGQDMVLLSGQPYAPFIYTGGVDDAVTAHIAGAGDPVVGFNDYCTSGRTTGNNCGHTDLDNNATVCTQTGCKSPVIAYNGGFLPQNGDSGAPFYVKTGGPDMHIRGHHIAGGGGTSYAEKFSRVASWFGVSIVT